jgi:calcineurin-like phosphoesterase family protein
MDEGLIKMWNGAVGIQDEIFHLGDFTLSKNMDYVLGILSRLNGRKYFIRGNHDIWLRHLPEEEYPTYNIEWVKDYHEMYVNHRLIVMFHFPLLTWHKKESGAIMLAGHTHGTINHINEEFNESSETGACRHDVGIDSLKKIVTLQSLLGGA